MKDVLKSSFHPEIWGIIPFLVFLLLGGILWYFQVTFPQEISNFHKDYFLGGGPFFAYLFGLGSVLLLNIVSFPHVPNLKLSLLSYLFLISGGFYAFQLRGAPYFKEWSHLTPLYFLVEINLLVISIVPAFIPRKMNRIACSLTVLTELGIISYLLGEGSALLNFTQENRWWIYCLCSLILIASWLFSQNSYGLGGGVSGLAFYYAFACTFQNSPIENIVWLSTPLLLVLIIFYNWFTRLSYRVSYDPLLNIYSREFCNNIIHGHANVRMGKRFSIAMVDIDYFKKINDEYGHDVGDRILHNVAQIVRNSALPQGITCRYGGEEIAVFFPQIDLAKAFAVAKKIHGAVGKTAMHLAYNQKKKITVSIGVAENSEVDDVYTTLRKADELLYHAKQEGRDQVKETKN